MSGVNPMTSKRSKAPLRPMSGEDCRYQRLVGGKVRLERLHPSGQVHFRVEFSPCEWARLVADVSASTAGADAALRYHMGRDR